MTYTKISPDFPVLLIKNYVVPDDSTRMRLIDVVLDNKARNCRPEIGFNFLIDRDYRNFFRDLYARFLETSREIFGDIKLLPTNLTTIWSYTSNNADHAPVFFHNHIHSATINAVYYLNIPASTTLEHGSIEFRLGDRTLAYRPNDFDLVLFPSYLDHQITFLDDDDYRISINMEIQCQPLSMPGWQP